MSLAELHVTDTGGDGPAIVFLHGNPTSSYLWRHVIERLAGRFRCVAVDLIGMGRSPRPAIAYDWNDHRRHLTPVLDRLEGPVWLAGHDWGAGLAVEYARTHPARVAGVAVTEGHLRPLPSWEAFDEGGRELFRRLRDPVEGRRMVEEENFFLSTVLPSGIVRRLTPEELFPYEEPYATPSSRHPIWKWVTQIPIGGDPPESHRVLAANWDWFTTTDVPLMLLTATPGAILGPAAVDEVRRAAPRLRIRHVGEGLHFLPEDRPAEIAAELADWVR